MPVFSRLTDANDLSNREDGLGHRFGSMDILSTPPHLKNHSGSAHPVSGVSQSALADGSRRRSSDDILVPPSESDSSPISFYTIPRPANALKGRFAHSPTIPNSSTDTNLTNAELTVLRKENLKLKVENGQLRGQIAGLK